MSVPFGPGSASGDYKEGYLYKRGARLKQWKERWFVFRQNFLYAFYSKGDVQPYRVFFLEGCFIEIPEEDEHSKAGYFGFEIRTPTAPTAQEPNKPPQREKRKTLYARSAEARMDWVQTIRRGAHSFPIQDFYQIGPQIGKGRFSVVHQGRHTKQGKEVAVKIIDKTQIALDAREKESLRTEIAILKLVRHPNIIKMDEIFESQTKLYIVMELVKAGDLFDRIIQKKRFPEPIARSIVWKLLSAVKYLHDRGIVHRDLKPENILCADPNNDTHVIIADFGLSKFASPQEVMNMPCGTLAYVAPEVLKLQGYSKAVDLWSIGVIMYLLFRGALPFDGKTKKDIIEATLHGKLVFDHECWRNVSPEAIHLITRLLEKSPDLRISIEDAMRHPWFNALTEEEKKTELRRDSVLSPLSAAMSAQQSLPSAASSSSTTTTSNAVSSSSASPAVAPLNLMSPTGSAVPAPLSSNTNTGSAYAQPAPSVAAAPAPAQGPVSIPVSMSSVSPSPSPPPLSILSPTSTLSGVSTPSTTTSAGASFGPSVGPSSLPPSYVTSSTPLSAGVPVPSSTPGAANNAGFGSFVPGYGGEQHFFPQSQQPTQGGFFSPYGAATTASNPWTFAQQPFTPSQPAVTPFMSYR